MPELNAVTTEYAANAPAVGQFGGPNAARIKARSRASYLRALATVSPLALIVGLAGPIHPAAAASCTPDTTNCDAAGGVNLADPNRGGIGGPGNGNGGGANALDNGVTIPVPGNPNIVGTGGTGAAGESPGVPGGAVGATDQSVVAGALNGGTGTNGPNGFNFASGGGGGGAGVYIAFGVINLGIQSTGSVTGGDGGAGGAGTSGFLSNGGGGGGGGAGVIMDRGATTNNLGTITGGNGGAGGAGGFAGGGGGGGDGFLATGGVPTLINVGSITGGKGGSGGIGSTASAAAGDSGAGVNMVVHAGSVFNVPGGTITGGDANGGAAGVGVMTNGGTAIINSGTISGGLNNDGVTHAAAIRFGGATNSLAIATGSTIVGDIQLIPGATATIEARNAGLTLTSNVVLGSGSRATFITPDNDISASGVVSGSGGVGVSASGHTVTFSGANTYTGGTTLTAGKLSVSSDANLGAASGALTFNGGTLQVTGTTFTGTSRTINWGGGGFEIVNAASSFVVSSSFSGVGALTKSGAGTLILTGDNSFTGGTTISQGILQLGGFGTTGSITGDVVNNGLLIVSRSNALTLDGNISGSGTFLKSGSGTTTLTGTNSYSGGTTLSAGALSVSSDSNLGAASGVLSFSGGTLQVTGTSFTGTTRTISWSGGGFDIVDAANNFVVTSGVTGAGALTKSGAGTLTLMGTAGNYTGGTTISAGTLQLGDNNSGAFNGNVLNNGTFAINRSDIVMVAGNISGSGALVQKGTGTTLLGGTNTYSGGTTIAAGTLGVSSDANLGAAAGALTFSGGTLQVAGDAFNGTARTINWNGGGFQILSATNNFVLSSSFTGGGGLTKSGDGTLSFTGNVSTTGGTTISAGTLQIGNGGTSGSLTGDVTNNSLLAVNRSDAYTFAGNISGNGAFQQRGTGTTILTGTSNYAGGTTISAGTLQLGNGGTSGSITGDVSNNGTFAVNRSDSYTFAGNISGNGAFVQSGTGTTILTGNNIYAGGTTISAGTLQLGNGGTSGAIIGDITNNGTLAVNRTDIFSLGGVISGSGAFVQKGAGTVILTGTNSYAGGTTVSLGTLSVSSDANLGAVSGALNFNAGGTLRVTGTGFTGTTRAVDLGSGGGAFDIADAANNFTLSQSITGNGSLFKLGAGMLTLTGDSSLTGGVGISAGTLQLGNGGTTGSFLGQVAVAGGLFAINRSDSYTFGNTISGNGAFEQRGTGTTILTGTNTYLGGTTITAGTLQLGNGGTSGSIVGDVANNGAFAINRSDTYTFAGIVSGSGAFAQIGSGTTILTSTNSYTGGTTIAAGTLQLGNGGTTGSIVGDVTNNSIFAVNRSDTFTFGGTISGTGAFTQSGTGTTILTGTNTYAGGTTLAAGTLSVSSDTNLGAASGALTFNGGTLQVTGAGFTGTARTINWSGGGFDIADAANNFAVSQSFAGTGALTKTGAGTLTFTGNNSYVGGTTIAAGTLQLGNGGTSGAITGDVTNNGTFAVNRADIYAFGGAISGSGAFAQRGTGTTVFTGTNNYTGGTTIAQGTLQIGDGGTTGAITGDVFNNGTLAFDRADAIGFTGAISGTGNLVKLGAGTLTLNGQYSYTGATSVNAGKLVVGDDSHANASLASAVTVNGGGTLGGIGTIGGLNVASGGMVTPGNSIGTLNVAGNVSFAAGSIYQIEANAAGKSDRIVATGTATLAGGNVLALAQTGVYAPQTVYNVLTANGGVSGTFTDVTTNLIFLTPSLTYDANNVFLTLGRNDTALASVAQTPNQIAVAGALDASGQLTNPLMVAVLNQGAAGARQAFDALSGEVHASAQTAMLDDSRYLRDAVLGRLRQSSFAGSTGPMAALATGGPQLAEADSLVASAALAYAGTARPAFPVKARPPAVPARIPETTFWTQGVGAWGQLDGNGNAARMTRDLAGFFSGVDHRFAANWVAGIAGGYTSSTVRVSNRASSADIQTAHIAGYTGASYGAFNLRGGAGASFSTLDTSRSIVFPGFVDSARARYDATTAQVFGEIGYGVALGNAALEPFAGLAYAHLDTDGFAETGGSGAAALRGGRNNEDVGYSSLGARIATSFALTSGMQLTPRASVAWQYAFGDVTPTAAFTFQSLGTGFTVAGVPLARSTALVEGGLDLRVTSQATVGVAYVGQLGDRVQDHSVKANFSWKF
ncbi:autotransporter-associated beta strand repeat-containing protein [Bradyrhizobium tropiciagri]|uniref:autotransporter-associated beta strand repeat-containing protein n=1 Tax=Bradyrhizobium tropiciagri TaxID=312253 RepID=UPI001BA8BF0F|nr:autotransporter-associated beta strand repeat-containing protein [Bradyrhizobium tropiciagri]MBR0868815.1 autotransporter-associated beta strand repeat-containing protein [Bradyrhizobium tropiciagri]